MCEEHCAPFDAFADAFFAESPISVWKASRGFGGKSLMLATLGYVESTVLSANVNILGGSGEQSERVHKYTNRFWDGDTAPRDLLVNEPSERHTRLNNGGSIVCLNASQKSVRGEHPQRLRLDEADEMDLSIFDAAMGQTMEDTLRNKDVETQTVVSSTHQYSDGTMTEILRRASANGWPVFEWCYKECMTEWLTERAVERKRGTITAEMWRVEYELGEPSIGNRAILGEAVDAMFDRSLGEYEGAPGELIVMERPVWRCNEGDEMGIECVLPKGMTIPPVTIFGNRDGEGDMDALDDDSELAFDYSNHRALNTETTAPSQRAGDAGERAAHATTLVDALCQRHGLKGDWARYVTGCDFAKEQDWTIIATYRTDVRPYRLVAYVRLGRISWKLMTRALDARMEAYSGRTVYDQTGVGNVVRDYLRDNRRTASGMVLTGRNEDDMLTEYIAAVERGDYKSPFIRHAYTEHKYATMDAIYGSDHLPDTVCANALAHRATRRARRRFGVAG